MKKVLEALFGSWPPPPRVRAICVAILILLLLAILFPQSFVAVILLVAVIAVGAVVLFFCNRVWKRDEAQAYKAALAERGQQLLYAVRACLFELTNEDFFAHRFDIVKPGHITQVECDCVGSVGSSAVFRFGLWRSAANLPFTAEDKYLLMHLLQKYINRCLLSQRYAAPPYAFGKVPVIVVWDCNENAGILAIDIAVVCCEEDAACVFNAKNSSQVQSSNRDLVDSEF